MHTWSRFFFQQPPATSLVEWRSLVGQLFSLSLFFLKLVQWWYSGEREAALRKMSALPVPPPPPREQVCSAPTSNSLVENSAQNPTPVENNSEKHSIISSTACSCFELAEFLFHIHFYFAVVFIQLGPDVIPLLSDQRLCPLCHQIRREPTALSTSG